jgi:hypothetical protein
MFTKVAKLLVATALISIVAAQGLGFTNFLLNLTLHTDQSLPLTWQGQDSYVNITLAQFYYFGGGSDYKGTITSKLSISHQSQSKTKSKLNLQHSTMAILSPGHLMRHCNKVCTVSSFQVRTAILASRLSSPSSPRTLVQPPARLLRHPQDSPTRRK